MASITIRNLDDDVKTRLRVRAADKGRSVEEEARLILRDAVGRRKPPGTSPAPFAPGSRLSAARIWSCPRASPDASRCPSTEAAAMFLLDTNEVSELLRSSPEPVVETWVGDRRITDLYFSAFGEAKLHYGVAILLAGQRQTALASAIEAILREDFVDWILPFDSEGAWEYADIATVRRSAGRPFAPADCQIAAIARSRNMTVATRNVRNFEDIEVEVVDPWTAA